MKERIRRVIKNYWPELLAYVLSIAAMIMSSLTILKR